jgi:hypothetical protein
MNKQFVDILIIVVSIALLIALFITPTPWDKYNLYDYLKAQRLQSYNEKHKEIFIHCIYCKGTGERYEDVNKLLYDAKMALWFNKHLMIDKCTQCVKLPHGSAYDYCETAENQYLIYTQEYGAAGPKMEKTGCSKCMGMGTFSSFDMKTQKYLTQEEYEQKEKSRLNDK